jgi:uncharacterized protein
MPIRSLKSSVLKWPDAPTVERAVRAWAEALARKRNDVLHAGYIGSYARGDWGVGSDLDIIIVVQQADKPFAERAAAFDATSLPVPVDLLIYTRHEWDALMASNTRFARTLRQEAVWIVAPGESGHTGK